VLRHAVQHHGIGHGLDHAQAIDRKSGADRQASPTELVDQGINWNLRPSWVGLALHSHFFQILIRDSIEGNCPVSTNSCEAVRGSYGLPPPGVVRGGSMGQLTPRLKEAGLLQREQAIDDFLCHLRGDALQNINYRVVQARVRLVFTHFWGVAPRDSLPSYNQARLRHRFKQ
jgi:hypothetical protein